jgi:phospholipid/cholesterol/gamma-HCH transport system ATP-binding protein
MTHRDRLPTAKAQEKTGMTVPAIIEVHDLTARYADTVILNRLDLSVYEGEILVVLGGSGCGKSTLLRHMVGLNEPHRGRIVIDGVDITACSESEYRRTLRKVAVLFQGGALFGSMTVADNVSLAMEAYTGLDKKTVDTLVRMKLHMVGLDGFEQHLPSELSGGMKKRAALARALALSPKILFLDEPSAGLDPVTSAGIDELIRHINRTMGTTIVIVTHELDSIFALAQRVIMLDKSVQGIIATGNPRELKASSSIPAVRRFFNRQSKAS